MIGMGAKLRLPLKKYAHKGVKVSKATYVSQRGSSKQIGQPLFLITFIT